MSTPILRGLSSAYSNGLIDRKQYIRERRQLIDDIVDGKVELVPYESPPAVPNPDLERTFSDGDGTLELAFLVDEEPAPAPAKSKRPAIIGGVLTLAGAVIVGRFVLAPQSEPSDPAPVTVIAAPEKAAGPNPAKTLLRSFLDENQWQSERLDAFVLAWRDTPPTARAALADGATKRLAADVIVQKILEEKALLELDEPREVLRTQRRLLDLAAELSLNGKRFARLEAEWSQTSARIIEHAGTADTTQPPAEPPIAGAPVIEPLDESAPGREAATPTERETAITPELDSEGTGVGVAPTPEPAAQTPVSAHESARTPALEEDKPEESKDPVADGAEQRLANAASPIQTTPAPVGGIGSEATTPTTKQSQRKSGCRAALAKQRRPYCRDALTGKLKAPALVVLPEGQAEMGGNNPEEQPRHSITIEQPFALGIYEVSFEEFQFFCVATKRECPAQPWTDPELPVVNVPWTLAIEYTKWLSKTSGATYRLPSESEWEYAARAGTVSVYPFGDEILPTHARFSFRAAETTPLASKDRSINRNKFRLYHMIGNVREWVLDVWHENYAGAVSDGSARTGSSDQRVVRGGSFADGPDRIRSASRTHLAATAGDAETGFRIVREID